MLPGIGAFGARNAVVPAKTDVNCGQPVEDAMFYNDSESLVQIQLSDRAQRTRQSSVKPVNPMDLA